MLLDSREKKILQILYENKEPLTMSYISKMIGVSSRTIKNDIKSIKKKIESNKLEIVTKRGVGVWLEIKDNEYFKKLTRIYRDMLNPILPDDRHYWIIKKLLNHDGTTSIEDLAAELYVSKSTIVKDLIKVEDYLSDYGLKIYKKPKHGIRVIGKEKDIRTANADILKNSTVKRGEIINEQLKNLLQEIDLELIQKIIQDSEEKFCFILSDISFKGLLIHLGISIRRMYEGKLIRMDQEELKLLQKEREWSIAKFIAKEIADKFKLDINRSEIGYITIHLVGAKLQNDIESEKISEEHLKNLNSDLYMKLKSIIKSLSKVTGYNFIKDKKLFTGLFLHLRTSIKRTKNNIKLDNPFLKDIKKNYSLAHEIAILATEKLNNFYNFKMNEDEIGYIALHFGAAIERLKKDNKEEKTAVIICATGIGTGQLLLTKFNQLFPNIKVEKILPLMKSKDIIKRLSPDIILSTVPVKIKGNKVVCVSPLLNENDIKKIQRVIKSNMEFCDTSSNKSRFLDYIDRELLFLNLEETSRDKIIKKISKRLIDLEFVEEGFYESVLEREKFSSTPIGNLVAIPHPYEGYIKEPKIAIATLKKPIQWGNNKTQIVFMIALDIRIENDFKKIFMEMSDVINSKDIISRLLSASSCEEFMEEIKRGV
ncbi:MAG: BglG family transcription antiterminator [Bacillota bacterium]